MGEMNPYGYVSPEQVMRDRAEFARKGVARGRSTVVGSCADGVLMVADNPSKTLHKLSEVLDRIGFAAVGRYNEFESLRISGIRFADYLAYTYSREDVRARTLASEYARGLGAGFADGSKPLEVELLLAEVAPTAEADRFFRISFDGSLSEEHTASALGGQAEALTESLRQNWDLAASWQQALRRAHEGLGRPVELEVALLSRTGDGRRFHRISDAEVTAALA